MKLIIGIMTAVALLSSSCALRDGHLLKKNGKKDKTGGNSKFSSYDADLALRLVKLTQATSCVTPEEPAWDCATCEPDMILVKVIDSFIDTLPVGRAIITYSDNQGEPSLFVAYRGTTTAADWELNAKFEQIAPFVEYPLVKVHTGLVEWYLTLKEDVDTALAAVALQYGTNKVVFTGHSAGGAVASLHAFDFLFAQQSPLLELVADKLYTFGSPRVGNSKFAALLQAALPSSSYRVVHFCDGVPHFPAAWTLQAPITPASAVIGKYVHLSTEVWYAEDNGSYRICDGSGEDGACSRSCDALSVADHLNYLGIEYGGPC